MGIRTLAVGLVGLGVLGAAACVGDSPPATPGSDGGVDATSDAKVDTGSSDGGADAADAAPPTCDVAKPFGSPVLISALAGGGSTLRLVKDYSVGYFNSVRDGGVGGSDLWTTTLSGGTFGAPTPLAVVNSATEDVYPTSTDGKTLIFASNRAGGVGVDDLWVATRSSTLSNFSTPSLLANVNTASFENTPFLREDGQKLYFASDRAPSQGVDDIWAATLNGQDFGAPIHVDELASSGTDGYPTVTPDDLVIYFASSRAGGKGGTDIWVATRTSTSAAFGSVTQVAEVNSAADELPAFITRDRCTLYMSANTGGGPHKLYVATKTP